MQAPPWRHWPTRLRHGLRRRMAARGLSIPAGLVIRYSPGMRDRRTEAPSIEVMHRPDATENMSVHHRHHDFGGDADEGNVLNMAERHALAMIRRDARRAAIEAAGHDPRVPPLHMLEASPLTALVMKLVEHGMAGIDGQTNCANGMLWLWGMVTTPSATFRLRGSTTIAVLDGQDYPETLAMAMAGRRLVEVMTMPRCGDDVVDNAVAALTIRRAVTGRELLIHVAPAKVVGLRAAPAGEDDSWKKLEPVPMV